jgi:hypothetical protein
MSDSHDLIPSRFDIERRMFDKKCTPRWFSAMGSRILLRTFPTKREAEDHLAEILPGSRQRRQTVVPVTITLDHYAERWLHLIASTVKPRTITSYAGMLRLHLLPVFGRLAGAISR